jgi:cyclic pyranopterin phosphate synthase
MKDQQDEKKIEHKNSPYQQKDPLTHINDQGFAKMVAVGGKAFTERTAVASAKVKMLPKTYERLKAGGHRKGDVLTVAQVAGIMASKRTSELIPMCHPLMLTACDIAYQLDDEKHEVVIEAVVKTMGQTGVEMEALTAASVCALTLYDMLKAMDQTMLITDICLIEKVGGKSGHFVRE